ncbi:glutamate-5-semialdehyde dehydrogenase [Amycolatopsis mediterranei]|uniref:glutamate-5-semialdehyde dehydrogenase n=1 Tax=Amycolatopsis mediterranei TaxID=33910 RepID=UPI0034281A14
MVEEILASSRAAVRTAPAPCAPQYADLCEAVEEHLGRERKAILDANAMDVASMRDAAMPEALVDRIRLDDRRFDDLRRFIDGVRTALAELASLAEPVREVGDMRVRRIRKPLGVVLMIYEARPTVTVEGALMTVAAGNSVILRGGREIAKTNDVLATVLHSALCQANLNPDLVHVVHNPDRAVLRAMLKRHDAIDVLIPRGSPSLVEFCRSASDIPVIASGGGVNHLYVHRSGDPAFAAVTVLDSKLPEPTACNTVETVLCDADVFPALLEAVRAAAVRDGRPCTLLVPESFVERDTGTVTMRKLSDQDSGREFLDRTFALRPVTGLDAAVEFIQTHGSRHTEGICATDPAAVARFCERVDAAAVVVNGSLRLHDGPTMGLGPEASIGTGRLHVRGPVDLSALTTFGWIIDANRTLRGGLRPSPEVSD